jgi:HEAT repeat protein
MNGTKAMSGVAEEDEANEPILPELVERLGDPDPEIRSAAARQLGSMGRAALEAAPRLRKCLKDSDNEVRIKAALALIQIDEGQKTVAVPILVKELSTDPKPRWWEDLPRMWERLPDLANYPRARRVLVELLSSPHPDVQDQAYRLLVRMKVGDEVVPRLRQLLEDRDPKARSYAALVLSEIGPAARDHLPVLRRLLEDDKIRVRWAGAIAILKIDPTDKPAQEALSSALNDPDLETRLTAAETILLHLDSADVRAIEAIRKKLREADPQTRSMILIRLSRLADRLEKPGPVVLLIAESLQDPDDIVRLSATGMLRSLGPKALPAVQSLIAALDDRYEPVYAGAARALRAIGPGARPAAAALASKLSSADSFFGIEVAAALVQVNSGDSRGVKYLCRALRSWDGETRIHALGAILGIKPIPEELISALVKVVECDKAGTPRYLAALALAESLPGNRDRIIPCLIRASKDSSEKVRRGALRALATSADESDAVIWALTEALQDKDFKVRFIALDGLGARRGRSASAVPALIKLLDDPRDSIRGQAAMTLARIGPLAKDAIPALSRVSQDPASRVRKAALFALECIAGKGGENGDDRD